MSDTSTAPTAEASGVGTIPMRFEVTRLPVSDFDRAKAFYQSLGWRQDIEFKPDGQHRASQFTPPGSPASVQFGEGDGRPVAQPLAGMILVVDDIDVARDDLIGRGVDVGEVWHLELGKGPVPGRDPEDHSYANRATFRDPDGNSWDLQQITERLPGRVGLGDAGALAQLLRETAERHGTFEAVAPPHDWWDWYAAYMDARERGISPDEAAEAADRYMAEVKGVVASRT
jgi:catechol 2,3-dioxygenase-like lactoylglutathione lyase family enzyme